METSSAAEEVPPLADASKRLAHRVFVMCENRFQLLMVEAQEERERILSAICMALIVAGFSLLAGITITIIVMLAFWDHYPVIALLVLATIYIGVAALFYAKIMQLRRDWQTLPATIEQLKKDRECFEKELL